MDETIQKDVLDILRTNIGPVVAEVVEAGQRKAAEQTQAPAWFDKFTTDRAEARPSDPNHFGRMLRVIGASGVNQGAAVDLAKSWYSGDQRDALVKSLTASSFTGGGATVPTQESSEIIEYLRQNAVVRGLGPTQVPMPNGNLSIARMTGGATATYVGEVYSATASQGTFGAINLVAKKLITLVPISNDLLRFANPALDAMIQRDAIAAMAAKEDVTFIRSDGTVAAPKGLKYWCPSGNLETVNATVNLANVTTDLGKLINNLLAADVRMIRPAWIFSPRTYIYLTTLQNSNGTFAFRPEMLANGSRLGPNGVGAGTLWGYPYGVTSQIPITIQYTGTANESEIYLVDMADFVIGDALTVTVTLQEGAAYYNSDGTLTGGYPRDESVLRIINEHDCAMRHEESVTYFADCDWGA